MMTKKITLLVVCLSFVLTSCLNDDSPNFHFTALEISAAELPESFQLNQTYRIAVDYTLANGCTAFSGFDVTKEDTTVRNVVAVGSVRTDADPCTSAAVEGKGFFNFMVIYDQPYTFKFYQGENEEGEHQYLEVVVPVEN